jgi:hypothetical protein
VFFYKGDLAIVIAVFALVFALSTILRCTVLNRHRAIYASREEVFTLPSLEFDAGDDGALLSPEKLLVIDGMVIIVPTDFNSCI